MKSDRDETYRNGFNRRKVLECMTWAGTGVLWTISGGVPRSLGIIDRALAAEPSKLTFLQISDSHVGFHAPANPNAIGTLQEAIGKVKSLPTKPSFMIHTGDITHLSKAAEFDDADRAISEAGLEFGEYSPLEVKSSVVGYGRAEKCQVQLMVRSLLRLEGASEADATASEDACDALAVAICHATHAVTRLRVAKAQR